MKSVLLSTRPKWCEKICHEVGKDENGKPIYEKSIEVRKTKPSIPTPFKVLLYCTSSNVHDCLLVNEQGASLTYAINYKSAIPVGCEIGNGKVIGEFICDKISKYPRNYEFGYEISEKEFNETALTAEQFVDYGKGKPLYGWNISQLKIYDKPKELREFYKPCPTTEEGDCLSCDCLADNDYGGICTNNLTRPPQSWCYVKELEERK